jgi:ADP-heptose:LPS heptosyltransferase
MHVAAALGKPVVALFGDSPVERWRPWDVPHRVVQPPSRTLADLPLEPVLEAYRALR